VRSIWKGAISFGLVSIPVKLYSATEEKNVALHQVHSSDGGRIRFQRRCSIDGEEVEYSAVAKGFETPEGETVILTDADLAQLPLSTSRAIEVLQFVPLEQVDPIYFSKSYFVVPDPAGVRPYALLRQAMSESGRVAIVKVALRQREALATLRARDNMFLLETMLWPDEVRSPDFGIVDEDAQIRPQELRMASSLIDSLSGDFEPQEYTDHYREALEAVINAKLEGREVVQPAEPRATGAVVDLMDALKASVEAAKRERSAAMTTAPKTEGKVTARVAPEKPPAKKATPKAAQKTAQKTTTTSGKKAATKTPAKRGAGARKSA
jgi:DNA end-binding protein Ku